MVLCRTNTTGTFRKLLEIEGRRKEEPWDPMKKGFGYVPPVEIFDVDGIQYESSGKGDASIRPKCQIVIYSSSSSAMPVAIPIPEWAMKNKEGMKHLLSKSELQIINFNSVESVAIHANDEELKLILDVITELKLFRYKNIEWSESSDGELIDVFFGSFITDEYMRAVAKVGFHYFLKYFPNYNGSEPQFDEIREFIKTGKNIRSGSDIDKFVSLIHRPMSRSQLLGQSPDWSGHILAAMVNHYGYMVRLQFFIISGKRLISPVYQILLGRNPYTLYYIRPVDVAHRFEYFKEGKQGKYDGQVVKVSYAEPWVP
jgi:hypothetical protein